MSSKKYSEYISDSVYLVNVKYTKLMNKTKLLYFRCLDEGRTAEYFEKEVHKIWGNIDHKFMDKQIDKLKELVHNDNVEQAINYGRFKDRRYVETLPWTYDDEFFKLTPESDFKAFERRYEKNVITNYKVALKSIKNNEKESYLLGKLDKYDRQINQVVAYYHKDGTLAHFVKLSTYLAMIHNTDLTRSGWNTTLSDAKRLGRNEFIIPFHPFSCLECFSWQNKILSSYQVEMFLGVEAVEQRGNILHPNCKCELNIYWSPTQFSNVIPSEEEIKEQYKIRQKVNSLTLKKSELWNDRKIAKLIGNQGEYDKLTQKISKVSKAIRDEVGKLPTKSLQTQVKAINR